MRPRLTRRAITGNLAYAFFLAAFSASSSRGRATYGRNRLDSGGRHAIIFSLSRDRDCIMGLGKAVPLKDVSVLMPELCGSGFFYFKELNMSWFLLLLAGVFEVGWAVGLKYTHGFTRFWPSAGTIFCMIVSLALLGLAVRHLPLGSAYAVWTGIGTIGTVICGILLLGESASAFRLGCVALIVAGIVGLKLSAH